MTIGLFFLFLLLGGWFHRMAARHRKDPEKEFYLGNVAPAGRKYVWLAFLSGLAAIIVFFSDLHG